MTPRIGRSLALLGLLGGGVVTLATAPAALAAPAGWCSVTGGVAPCIVSAKKDGVDLMVFPDGPYEVVVDGYSGDDVNHYTGFTVFGLGEADLGHTFEVVMKTHIKPRVVSGWGAQGRTVRSASADADGAWTVKTTMKPVKMLNSCDGAGDPFCPSTADPSDVRYEAHAEVSDGSWFSNDPAEWDDINGLDQFSNINLFWYPPTISTSSTGVVTIDWEMQNSRYWPDGTTLFKGFANVRLPNAVLRKVYGIPNPETMTDGSFTGVTSSGSITSYQEGGDDAWRVDLTGATFSFVSPRTVAGRMAAQPAHLKLKRGVITPTRPTITRATRVSARSARLAFTLSRARGAKPTGYDARCVSPGGHVATHTKTTPTSPIYVSGLKRGTSYVCKVRARSKAGPSAWSLGVKVARRP
jgi:hypothetical protein